MKKMFGEVKKILKTHRFFLKDASLNMVAFAIYIFSQQILLLPILARILDANSYANIIIFINIMNVFCNVLGGQLGVTHQLQKKQYEKQEDERNDFAIFMLIFSFLITICFGVILSCMRFEKISIVFLTFTVLISNYRLYIRYYFRINSKYNFTILQNIFYMFGMLAGLGLLKVMDCMWLPVFMAEVFAFAYTLFVIPTPKFALKKSLYFNKTAKRYLGLGSADVLTNMVTLVDKLLVFPLLGAYSLAVYNAGTSISKVTALIMNPLNEVLLVRLSKAREKGLAGLLKMLIIVSLIVSIIMFVLLIPIIYVFSYILYRQYLDAICTIIFLLSLRCAIGITTSVMKSFILRYAKPSQLTKCYLFNLVILAVGGYWGAKFGGLVGFTSAMVLGQVTLWGMFVLILAKYCCGENFYE